MPDEGEYDPLLLQREDGISPDAHVLFKLDEIALVDNQRTAIFSRVPVPRDGWFYKALPKWGFEKMTEAAFIKLPLKEAVAMESVEVQQLEARVVEFQAHLAVEKEM